MNHLPTQSAGGTHNAAAKFDPYFKWLGIPPEEQPPTHYRLLAIPPFTADLEVIENAADQRMAHLKSVQTGARAALSQKLLNQIAEAKRCLLDDDRRREYDKLLRHEALPPKSAGIAIERKTSRRPRISPFLPLLGIVGGGMAGLAAGYFLICWVSPRNDFLHLFPNTGKLPSIAEAKQGTRSVELPTLSASLESVPKETKKPKPSLAADFTEKKEPNSALGKPNDPPSGMNVTSTMVKTPSNSSLETQLELAANGNADDREAALELAKLLEQAIEEKRFDLSAKYAPRLLTMARKLDDRELERRGTLIVLKRDTTASNVAPPLPVKTAPDQVKAASKSMVSDEDIVQLLSSLPKSQATQRNSEGKLTNLDCRGVTLSESQLEIIGSIESLRVLYLPQTKLNDAGIKKLAGLSSLERLGIWNTEITDEGMQTIAEFKHLNNLSIEGNGKIGDEGIKPLSKCRELTELGLSWTGITDDGLLLLTTLPALKSLGLNHTNITDRGLEQLAQIKSLTRLAVVDTAVTEAGVARLKAALPSCEVVGVKPQP